jgi:NAD(P)-dependent dehydrogenase (short-subunit alcohol dehydrogenase family)
MTAAEEPHRSDVLSLHGKVAVVTGGTRGIGRAIAETFTAHGAHVVVCGRNAPPSLARFDAAIHFISCDVRDPAQVDAIMDEAAARHGRLDVLVNNAGGSPYADAATASPRFAEKIIALNLLGPLYASQAAHRWMSRQPGGGSIVNICSVAGVRPAPSTAAYGAAKAGLLHLTESLAQEWGPAIRVNAIVAGLIDTEEQAATYGSDETRRRIGLSVPLRRMGRGQDIAAAALYLASPLAAYVSGARLAVHGGGERPPFLDIIQTGLMNDLSPPAD